MGKSYNSFPRICNRINGNSKDGIYPTDFEVVLVVMKDGDLSGGCVERGSRYTDENWRGVIRQNRGGVIDYEDILAWKPIENINVFEISQ